ncbi:MAG: hypothetical protein QM484_00405 [Woeseiaceae bacterium]
MHTIQVHIDENLSTEELNEVKQQMSQLPHVTNVEVDVRVPHDFLVEYENHYNIPMLVMDKLHHRGLHPDIVSA